MLTLFLLAAAPGAAAPAAPAASQPATAAICPAWGAKPPGCVEPPLRETISIYGSWRESDGSHPADTVMIRRPALIGKADDPAGPAAFPAFLRVEGKRSTAQITLRLIVSAEGRISACTPSQIKAWSMGENARQSADLTPPAGLGEQACAMVRASRTFHPALDPAGNRIEAAAEVLVDYSVKRHDLPAPPAPAPPSRWLGRAPYERQTAWPPRSYLSEGVQFTAPKFKDFLTDRKGLPRQAVTGVLMDFAPDGRALSCKIGLPSSESRLDAATCAALMSVQNRPTRWQVRALPIEVHWKGDKARVVLPVAAVLPGLAAPIVFGPDAQPAGELPKLPVRIRVLLDGQGKPVTCTVVGPSYFDEADAASCRIALRDGQFASGRDVFGRPAAGGMDLWADWTRRTITGRGGPNGY